MIKVERSQPAPESLVYAAAHNGSYCTDEVVNRLSEDFHNKCYICGIKPVSDPQIEHRLPHMNGLHKERKYDWNNLFWSCPHCNSVKNNGKYAKGIIDCCVRDPETVLLYELQNDNVVVKSIEVSDDEAVLTANLIDEVFNLKNTQMRVIKSEVRVQALICEMNAFLSVLKKYYSDRRSSLYRRTLKAHLRRESAFSEFKRAYIRKQFRDDIELCEMLQ